jgi:hypothetical protein
VRSTRYQPRVSLWHDHDDHTYDAFFAWEPSLQSETILFGSPACVCEQMARVLEVSGCHDVTAFAWGTLSHDQTQRSLWHCQVNGDLGKRAVPSGGRQPLGVKTSPQVGDQQVIDDQNTIPVEAFWGLLS